MMFFAWRTFLSLYLTFVGCCWYHVPSAAGHSHHHHHHHHDQSDEHGHDHFPTLLRRDAFTDDEDTVSLLPPPPPPLGVCGTRDPTATEFQTASTVVTQYMAQRGRQQQQQNAVVVEIDTYFHVVTDGTIGKVTSEQLQLQLQVLNDSFRPYGFTFRWLGNTTTDNTDWHLAAAFSSEQKDMKEALRTGDASSLNVYITYSGGYLGYATLPSSYENDPIDDGVVIYYDSLPLGRSERYNDGKTLVHEVGHWLGLYHTFQLDLGFFRVINLVLYVLQIRNNCNTGQGDGIRDTPRQKGPTFGCPVQRDSCPLAPGMDPIHNFMDYSDDVCMTSFTPDQQDRMMAMWLKYRAVN